jgi:hypothetical protein
MSEPIKIQGPVEVELKVYITDGMRTGVVTIGMGKGRYPSEADLRKRIEAFAADQMPDGFSLMNKRQFWDELVPPIPTDDDEDGPGLMRFAMPGGDDFDA